MQLQQVYTLLSITIFALKLFGNSYRRDHSKISNKDSLCVMAHGISPATKGGKSLKRLRHVNNENAKQFLYSLKKKKKIEAYPHNFDLYQSAKAQIANLSELQTCGRRFFYSINNIFSH